MLEPTLWAAAATAILALIGGLVKLGWGLRGSVKERRKSSRPPALPTVARDDASDVTGRHELQAILDEANPEAVPSRLDRLERGAAQILRHVGSLSKSFANFSVVAESLDALSQIEALRAKREENRDRWFESIRNEILAELKERDLAVAKRTVEEIEKRFLLHPKRR